MLYLSHAIKKEETKDFTRTRWGYIQKQRQTVAWLHGENRRIAEIYKHCLEIEFGNVPEDAGVHSTCYRRFIDKKRLDADEKRVTQRPEAQDAHEGQSVSSGSRTSTTECPTKKLGSRTAASSLCSLCFLPCACFVRKWTSTLLWQENPRITTFHRQKHCQQASC